MGVDAGIFAVKAKKYLWFDREHNLRSYWDLEYSADWNKLEDVWDKLTNSRDGVSREVIMPFLLANKKAWAESKEEDQRYREGIVDRVIKFVDDHPDDLFFIANDHNDAYDYTDKFKQEPYE